MRVLLVYPPDRCLPTVPYSSLPALKACLREAGHDVGFYDLNVEVFHRLVQKPRLEWYYRYAEQRVRTLEQKAELSEVESREYRFLAPLVAAPIERLLRAEEDAHVMRDQARFFDPALFNQAFDDLHTTIRFLYAANPVFDPESLTFVQENLSALAGGIGDPVSDAYRETLLDEMLATNPKLVGITMPFSFQFFEGLKFAYLLKEKAPHVKVVVGGPTINDYKDTLFTTPDLFPYFDFAIAGEGEQALVKLVSALEHGTPLCEVPNLFYCENGEVKRSTVPPDLPDLNALPTPDFSGIPFDKYLLPEPVGNIQTSRGCYYGKCTFCGDGFRRNFRMRRPELVFNDVKKIAADGVKYFLFWDSLAPPKTLKAVAQGVQRENLDIHLFAETKFEQPYTNPELIDTLYKGGFRFLQFGFESASQRVLDLIDKGNDIPRVDKILANMKRTGLMAGTSWFIGFPTETRQEALQTFDFVAARQDRIAMSVYAGTFMLGRDTLVYSDPERYGIDVVRTPQGGLDYVNRSGAPRYDRTELDFAFRARGDLPLLNTSAYLLYATHAPDKLRAITGLGRFGLVTKDLEDPSALTPQVAATVHLREFEFDLLDSSGPTVPRKKVLIAYSAKTGMHHAVPPQHRRILEACDGKRTVAEVADRLGVGVADIEADLRVLIDRGVLQVPLAQIPAPELELLAT
ncbi:MAG: cobalamin-dependent protein [Planctomycetota bacterium]